MAIPCGSHSVTRKPRSASARAVVQPARPAPATITLLAFSSGAGNSCHGRWLCNRLFSGPAVAAYLPASISRLRPKPGTFEMLKPAPFKPRLTMPAAVKVATVGIRSALGFLLMRRISENSASDHIAGFFAGAKPSRNQASTGPFNSGRAWCTSSKISVKETRSSGHLRVWNPLNAGG